MLAVTMDGGQLAWKITQISWGIKIMDPRSVILEGMDEELVLMGTQKTVRCEGAIGMQTLSATAAVFTRTRYTF